MTAPLLEVRDLHAGYGKAEVLHGLHLHAKAGEVITVIGPNGAGKSTLLAALMGVIGARGAIVFDGRDMGPRPLEQRVMHGMALVPEDLLGNLGPAVGSGRSILMYGPPGNGKSSISNGIRDSLGDRIYIPRAVEYSGQVITVYDPIVHSSAVEQVDDPNCLRRSSNRYDQRYVLCQRPSVITGGELTLDMLDLKFNAVSRTYTAPLQMKSNGGIFIVDDLGRQSEPPQKLVNRWIVPLEESRDILQLQSGEKFTVPFDTLVIFSTNFHPNEIFDGAALRRIFFKIKIDGPNQENFLKIFALVARKKKMPIDQAAVIHLLKNKYPTINNTYANYQPVFLIDQMIAICEFEGIPYQMSPELIERAWANMFVKAEFFF